MRRLNLKKVPYPKNKAFCVVPWTHSHVSPMGDRRLCCFSLENNNTYESQEDGTVKFNSTSLKDFWNGEYLRGVRKKMLQGEMPEECKACAQGQYHVDTYQNYYNVNTFPHKIEQAYESTADDGSTTMEPISLDYRLSNHCDFKCRTCSPNFSSRIEAEIVKETDPIQWKEPWMKGTTRDEIKTYQKGELEDELFATVESGRLEEMYWAGGEPLIWPTHWEAMKRLIDLGHAQKVHVRYNTNLARLEYKGLDLVEHILPHMKSFTICASIDGYGEVGEFIRTGLVWDNYYKNLLKVVDFAKRGVHHKSVGMDVTLTLPGLFAIEELLDISNELNIRLWCTRIYDFHPSIVLSPLALPRKVLNSIIDPMIKRFKKKTQWKNEALLNCLLQLKKEPTFEEKFDNWREGFYYGRAYQKLLAKRRKDGQAPGLTIEDIYSRQPAVLEWWQSNP